MKVSIRKEELRQILSAYFRMEVEDFSIVAGEPSVLGNQIRSVVTQPLDKTLMISNIKMLRHVLIETGQLVSLPDAKWAIENWVLFIGFVDMWNRLPLSGYGSGKEKGILK